MPIIGYRRAGQDGGLLACGANTKYLMPLVVDATMRIAKLSLRADGLGAGEGDGQPLMGVIYNAAGELVAETEEFILPRGSEEAWYDLRFDNVRGGVLLAPDTYRMGFISGAPASARFRSWTTGQLWFGADTYGPVVTTLKTGVTLPAATIEVTSTTGFDSKGEAFIGGQAIRYTGKEAEKLTGVTGGAGAVAAGIGVEQRGAAIYRDQPVAVRGSRLNRTVNPDFETNTTGWTLATTGWTATSITREASPAAIAALGSAFSARVKGTHEATTTERFLNAETPSGTSGFPVTAGQKYAFSAYVYANDIPVGANNIRAEIIWYKAAGTVIGGPVGTAYTVAATTLTRISTIKEAPAEAAFAQVRVVAASLTSGDTVDFWLDNVLFEQKEEVLEYFPTNPQSAEGIVEWEGTAHASKSWLLSGEIAMFATYFQDALSPAISDIQIGRYPFAEAQAIFGEDPPQEGTSSVATCSWHGTILNPERGSFCVVQRGGRFADLVGDRVRVSTFTGRAVNAYVIAEAELEDDISLTRRLFMELGLLSADDLNVRIEILSTEALE